MVCVTQQDIRLTAAELLANATNVSHRDQLKVTGWKRKREKNLPSSLGNAKQDPAEPNPLFSQPWASIYRTAKARPTLTSKVVATHVNLHGSCSAQAVIVTFLLSVPIPDGCPLIASACQQRPAQHTLTRCLVIPNMGGMEIYSKKSKLKNSQRVIFSSQKILGVECGHWTVSSCLAAPPWCDLKHTHRISCAIQDIPPSSASRFVSCTEPWISPRY